MTLDQSVQYLNHTVCLNFNFVMCGHMRQESGSGCPPSWLAINSVRISMVRWLSLAALGAPIEQRKVVKKVSTGFQKSL